MTWACFGRCVTDNSPSVAIDTVLHLCVQAQLQNEKTEHVLIRPKAQRPQSGVSQHESGRDPRAHHMAARQARSVMPQSEQEVPGRTSAEQPQGRAAPHVPSDSARASPEASLGTAQSPEVLAAAQTLLQSQLQQLAAKPELLCLFHALCADSRSSGELLPPAPAHASAPEPESESPFQHGKSQSHSQPPMRPVMDGLHHDMLVPESRFQAGTPAKLGRTDNSRGVVENSHRRGEGNPTVHLSSMKPINANVDSGKVHSIGPWQQDSQTQAAIYAQHLYGLLAAQAQVGLILGVVRTTEWVQNCCSERDTIWAQHGMVATDSLLLP